MDQWIKALSHWEGTANELADKVGALTRDLGLSQDTITPNERLVRHYVQSGILSRPERRGKEAHFGLRQILEFIAARVLSQDGWPMAKIAEMVQHSTEEELRDLIPRREKMTSAQELVERFKQNTAAGCTPRDASPISYSKALPMTQRRLSLKELLAGAGNPSGQLCSRQMTLVELSPWCQVLFDPVALKQLPPELPEILGQALTLILQSERNRQGGQS